MLFILEYCHSNTKKNLKNVQKLKENGRFLNVNSSEKGKD